MIPTVMVDYINQQETKIDNDPCFEILYSNKWEIIQQEDSSLVNIKQRGKLKLFGE